MTTAWPSARSRHTSRWPAAKFSNPRRPSASRSARGVGPLVAAEVGHGSRGGGDFHDESVFAVFDGLKVVVPVEGLGFVIDGVDDDESASADFCCGDRLAECVEE